MKIYPPYSDGVSKLEGKSKTSLYSQLQSRVLRGGPSSVISFGFVFHFSRLSVAFLYSSSVVSDLKLLSCELVELVSVMLG